MFTATVRLLHPDWTKVKMRTYFSFSPKALPFTKAGLNRFAPEIFNKKFNPQEIADSGIMLGRQVRVRITHEPYEGQPRAKIAQILPAATEGASANGGGKSGAKSSDKKFFQ